ncbi:tagatose 3-epimerase [Frondihabitans sucicola]|uniref:Tagatose 3-epimerase n=1 Tax=Frondihabitans sucicola TaxID=1268041 RepID=A0ABN6XSL0_9MICO|nr:sugar phosphate isomerase/epimerase family protein [Frondihabitans sucicola]BDZ47974.1 tagatose 3-epimerase [Frondihabitans sucicola]
MTATNDNLPIAVNTFVWYSPLTDAALDRLIPRLPTWGYDAVELAYENASDWTAGHARDLLQTYGIRSVVGAVFGDGRNLTCAPDAEIETTKAYVRSAIDLAVAQGSELVIGPMYTAVGRVWKLAADERVAAYDTLRTSLTELGDYAATRGVALAVEPLNRYETSLINTVEQLMEVIDTIPAAGVGINLDSYHMNIEEKSMSQAILDAGPRLLHMQVCGNDRGAPGEDHLDWEQIRRDLAAVDYQGFLGFESFTADNASIATAASIWRSFAPTQDDLAIRAADFLTTWRNGWPPLAPREGTP